MTILNRSCRAFGEIEDPRGIPQPRTPRWRKARRPRMEEVQYA